MTLAAHDISFAYPPAASGQLPRPALQHISFQATPGCVSAIIGPNGSGKSTLLRLLLGSLTPASGKVQLDGQPLASIGIAERARRIGYLAQRVQLASPMTVRAAVALGRHTLPHNPAAIDLALEQTQCSTLAAQPFHTLSLGQQQRVMLARVLAQLGPDPAGTILLADEPAAALDPLHALQTMTLLGSLASRGAAVVVVLHDLNLALRFSQQTLILHCGGTVAAQGPTTSTLTTETLTRVFGTPFDIARTTDGQSALLIRP